MTGEATILTVCSGNICRSPFIERALQRELDRSWGPGRVAVGSAGTIALVGHPMEEQAARHLTDHGYDSTGFTARELNRDLVAGADLVITATRVHRGKAAQLYPRALRHTFTLRELAALLVEAPLDALPASSDPAEHVRAVARLAAGRRGMSTPLSDEDADVIDPYRREERVFAQMTEQIMGALPVVASALAAR